MLNAHLQRLEGVWTGTEHISEGSSEYEASARLVFQAVFDGRFLLCDYAQTVPGQPTAYAHGVFRCDERTSALTVTWFRSPAAAPGQQTSAVAEGDKLIFYEAIDGRTTRTSYSSMLDRLIIYTERGARDDWKKIFEGTYRRR